MQNRFLHLPYSWVNDENSFGMKWKFSSNHQLLYRVQDYMYQIREDLSNVRFLWNSVILDKN